MTILVSPAEPATLRKIGETSALCETLGADFLIPTSGGLVGIQRKEVRDLVASLRGDRIARELGQSAALVRCVLVVEGDWGWGRNGESRTVPGFLRPQYDGFCLSIQNHGWWICTSDSMAGTARLVKQIESWFQKTSHTSLAGRPNHRGAWGTTRNRDFAVHLLQSFDGIGVEQAGRIWDHFQGVPLAWTVDKDEMMRVAGIGPGRVAKLLDALEAYDER